jgi:hypothetical protein
MLRTARNWHNSNRFRKRVRDKRAAVLETVIAVPENGKVRVRAKRTLTARVVPRVERIVRARTPVQLVDVALDAAPQQIAEPCALRGLAHAELAQVVKAVFVHVGAGRAATVAEFEVRWSGVAIRGTEFVTVVVDGGSYLDFRNAVGTILATGSVVARSIGGWGGG